MEGVGEVGLAGVIASRGTSSSQRPWDWVAEEGEETPRGCLWEHLRRRPSLVRSPMGVAVGGAGHGPVGGGSLPWPSSGSGGG